MVGSGWGSSFGIPDLCLCVEERKDLLIYFFEISCPCLLESRLNDVSQLDRCLAWVLTSCTDTIPRFQSLRLTTRLPRTRRRIFLAHIFQMFQFYPNHLHFNNWFGFQRLALFVETASEILDSLDRFVVFELKVTRWHLNQA